MERVGKWREMDYTAPVYPSFACGAGNILSADLVEWLALNKDHLKMYQVYKLLIITRSQKVIHFLACNIYAGMFVFDHLSSLGPRDCGVLCFANIL